MSFQDLESEIIQAQNQALASSGDTPFGNASVEAFRDRFRRSIDPVYARQRNALDAETYDIRNKLNQESNGEVQLRAEAKVKDLIDRRISSSSELFKLFNSDTDLQVAFPTNGDKITAIADIQNQISEASNPYNALNGYQVEGEGGFFSDLVSGVIEGLGGAASELYYSPKRALNTLALNKLPLNQLDTIKQKFNTRDEIQAKIAQARDKLFSPDITERTKALKDLQYYQGTIDGLSLTPEEQRIWDTYGDEYDRLKAEELQIDEDKANLLGTNKISASEAEVLMRQYGRNELHKQLGLDPSFGQKVWDYMKDSVSSTGAAGKSLGNILSTVIPFLIHPALGAASAGSLWMEYSSKLLQDHLNEFGEIDNTEILKASLYGGLAAGIDYYGSKGFTKGYNGVAGQFFRGLGKTDAERIAAKGAKELQKKWATTLRGLTEEAKATVIAKDIQNFLLQDAKRLSEQEVADVTQTLKGMLDKEIYKETLGSKAKKAIASLPNGIRKAVETPVKAVEGIGKALGGVKNANAYLHKTFDASIGDMAKAGIGLAGENVGSALVRQSYTGKYDEDELARGIADGFVSGGLFHGASGVVGKGYSKVSPAVKTIMNKFTYGGIDLDSKTNFNTFVDKIKNANKDSNFIANFDALTSPYLEQLEAVQERVDKAKTENQGILDTYGKFGLVLNDKGEATIDEQILGNALANSAVTRKDIKEARNKYLNNKKLIDKAGTEVESRIAEFKAAVKEGSKKILDTTRESTEYTEEEKESVKQSYVNTLNENEQVNFLREEEGMDEQTAKEYLEAKKNKSELSEEYTTKVADTDVSIAEVFKRGDTEVLKYADILKNPEVRKAIANTDKEAFDKAIDALVKNKEISQRRADVVKNQLNADKFAQYTRYETNGSRDGVFNSLNKAVQKDVVDSLGLKDKVSEDEAKANNAKLAEYTKQYLTNGEDKTILQKAKDIKDNLGLTTEQGNIVDKAVGEVQQAIEDAIKQNKQLIGKKVYKSKEEAEKALKDTKLGIGYKVNEVVKGSKYTLVEKDTQALQDIYDNLKSKKEDITKQDIDSFIDEYLKDLDIDESSSSKVKDKILKTFQQYHAAPKDNKSTVREALLGELNKLIKGRKATLAKVADIVANQSKIRSAIHGYSAGNKDYIGEAEATKKEKALKRQQAKEKQEQLNTNKRYAHLTDIQAKMLTVYSLNALYNRFTRAIGTADINSPETWARVNIFTQADLRNLHALLQRVMKIPNSETRQQYIQTMISVIEHTNVQQNTVNTIIDEDYVNSGDTSRSNEAITSAIVYNGELRDAFQHAFPQEEISQTPMSIPEVLLADNINEAANDFDTQEKARALHQFSRVVNTHWARSLDILNALRNASVDGNSILETIAKNTSITLPNDLSTLRNNPSNLTALMKAVFNSKEALDFLGLNPTSIGVTRGSNKNGAGITSFTELQSKAPNKQFNFRQNANEGNTTAMTAYNDSRNLADRLTALDRVFGGTGAIIHTLGDTSSAYAYGAIYKELLDTLKINTRANAGFYSLEDDTVRSIIRALSDTESVTGLFPADTNTAITEDAIMAFVNRAYNSSTFSVDGAGEAEGAYVNNRASFIKQMLLYVTAKRLQSLEPNHTQSKRTDEAYNNTYKQYQIIKSLPDYLPENFSSAKPINEETVSNLNRLLQVVAPRVTLLRSAVEYIQNQQRTGQSSLEAGLTEDQLNAVIDSLYTSDGYLKQSSKLPKNLPHAEAIAKILQAVANEYYVTNVGYANNGRGNNNLRCRTRNTIRDAVEYSAYRDQVIVVGNRCILCGENTTGASIRASNENYAGNEQLDTVFNEVTELSKQGSRFVDSNLIIDKMFGVSINGNTVYNQEVLNVLSATGLNNLMQIDKGQSDEFLQSLVSNKVITSAAKSRMLLDHFSDYQSTCMSLGRQALHSLGLRIASEDSMANIEERLAAELGARALQLLEAAGYVEKKYVTAEGRFVDDQPKGTYIRAIRITSKGAELNTRISEASNYTFTDASGIKHTGHVLEELLNGTNEKLPLTTDQARERQTQLREQFDADRLTHKVDTYTANLTSLADDGTKIHTSYTVEVIPFTGLTRVHGDIRGQVTEIYLPRSATYKANGVMNSPEALVELAYKSTEERTFDSATYEELIGKYIHDVTSWQKLPESVQQALGMDLDPLDGYYETYRIQKNEQIFRRAKEFDRYARTLNGTERLTFPVVMTPNNRFLVDSPIFDYREFKPVRDLFHIVNSSVGIVSLKNPDGTINETKQTMAMATILFNMGVDVDKMTFSEIRRVFEYLTDTLHGKRLANKSIDDINKYFEGFKFTVYKGKKDSNKKLKFNKSLPAQMLFRELQNNRSVLQNILDGKSLTNFHYMIEVDGLNNGSAHHFAQSGIFSNTDSVSIAKAIAVGMVPNSIREETTFGDFISLMVHNPEGFRDVYMQSAETAKEYTVTEFIEDVVTDIKKSELKEQLLNTLADIFDLDSNLSIEDKIAGLMSRDVMKKVAMPSTYGAGFDALLSHLSENITKEIAKRRFDETTLTNIYDALARYNGGELVLLDKTGKTVMYSKVKSSLSSLKDYLPFIEGNTKLFNLVKDTCLSNTVRGAKSVTEEATERGNILSNAVEAQCQIFTAMVQKILKENYAGRDLGSITYREQEAILNSLNTRFNFGTQHQTLDTLRPAVLAAIKLADYHNKVTAHYKGGHSAVRFGSDLAKESLGSAFSPIYIHGFDASNIAEAQQIVRNTLGAFTGIHDAVMINLRQFTGEGTAMSVPKAMNKSFIDNALTAYAPLLEMSTHLQQGLDKLSDVLSEETIHNIQNSMRELNGYAALELSNIYSILQEAIKDNGLTINQFPFGEATAFRLNPNYAQEQLNRIQERLGADQMKNIHSLSAEGFVKWLESNNKGAFDALNSNREKLNTLVNINSLMSAIREGSKPFGNITLSTEYAGRSLRELIDEYVKHAQCQYNSSFFKTFNDAMAEQAKNRTNRLPTDLTHSTTGKTAQETLVKVIDLLSTAEDLIVKQKGNTVKHLAERSSIIKQINQRAYKLLGLRMDNSDTYDALAMLVELTTKYNIPTQDLVRLKERLNQSAYLNENLNLSGFNSTANSIVVDATEINLSDTLNHIHSKAIQTYSADTNKKHDVEYHENIIFTNYVSSYMNRLEDRLRKTGATQIILKMDSAIDYMLLPAINQRIQNSITGSIWKGRTITIVPNISDVSSGSINKTKTHLYALEKAIGKDNLHSFTVLNSTENKDLDTLNYKYHGQFTRDSSMTGQNFDNTGHAVYFDKDTNTDIKEKSIDLDSDNPDIYIANYYGEIQSHNPKGICTPVMLQTQKSASDVEGITEYETNVAEYTYGELPETPADMITTDGTPNLIDITASIPEFTAGSHFVVGLNSDGTVMNNKIYNSAVSHIPALAEAYEQAKNAYARMERKYAADPDMNMDIVHQPITIKTHLDNLTPVKVTFVIGRDNRIPASAILPYITVVANQDKNSARYTLMHEGLLDKSDVAGRRALAQLRSRLRIPTNAARDSNAAFSKWLAGIQAKYDGVSPDKIEQGMETIPDNVLNLDSTTYDNDSILRDLNINKMCEISNESNVIFLGTDANPYFYRNTTSNPPTLLSFNRVKNYESQKTVGNRIASSLATATYNTVQSVVDTWRMHRYSNQKSPEDMGVYDTAVYEDLNCNDSQNLFDTLVSDDRARNIETSHLNPVFSRLKSLNMNVRYYLNKLAYSQGGAFIETINAKPTGYINFNTRGTGSHAEVFVHEYTHIPLEYLKYDPNAYRLATQLYQFSAKNLTLDDFECSRDEANRIYNYIFRDSGTTDPQIEFLTYSLTNADFRKALDNMAKRVKFKDEFDSKTESLLARFVNKVSGSLDTSHVSNDLNNMVFDIFKRSVDLCNEYGKKAPRDEKAYLAEKMQLSNADMKIQNAITSGLSKVSEALSSIADTSVQRVRTEEALRLAESNQDSKIANQMKDILPAMMDALPSASEGFQDIANQLRQSFEGVSDNNYAYVKLRYQAKETIDKARENSASALNEVIRKATKNISQKTLNEMSAYVLKSDMSCLVSANGYTKQELGKILTDKNFRKSEIERLEKILRHNTFGNFYVNASRGLVDKLTLGVNTSGIGYNNAYEIANMSGTATASLDSPMESEIDKYITLSTMDKLDAKNPKVYKELSQNLDTLTELLNIHNGLKGMEYSQVYPTSMQRVHIPKGELHGGKVTNRYTVVPKSQLKAYKWAGYNSLGKVKFDPFYNSLMNEDFYKVEAKHMPNVPYVDGIPVLTDIFNGRNKTDTYLGGKKLETTQISPSFQNQEFQVMSGYLARKVQELNSPNFRPLDPKNIDGVLTPTFGIGNKLSGCDFQLNEKDSDKYLNRHVKFTSALGDHYGSIIERMRAPDWNNQVAQALDDLYQQRHTKNDFTWLKEDTDNKEQLEVYKLLPFEIKQFFKDKYGVDGVPVETRYLTGIVGYREISASKVDLEWNNKLRKSFTDYVSHIFHNGYVAKGENFLRYLTKLGKENIVIKGVAVSVDNILSNNVTLSVLGLSPEKVCKYQIEGLNNLLKYKEMSRERYMLKTKELTNSLTDSDRARIRALEASMHALPISYLAEHGGTPTIAEDVTESDRLAKDFIDTHFKKEFQTIAHNAIGDQKSWVYKHLSDLATFGDITARYAQFKYLTEDKHINQEEAFRQCMQTFIDYSNPLPKSLQYFDSIGALPFTKFLLGNQTNVLNSLVRKPSRALAGIMATSAMGIPSIYDSILGLDSIVNRWKVPGFGLWYDSLGTLPINRAFDIL